MDRDENDTNNGKGECQQDKEKSEELRHVAA
jgi:hypothetical protein